ncbi:hypothetical protein [Desulforhopalus sp. 52FAK]
MSNTRNREKKRQLNQEQLSDHNKTNNIVTPDRVCVIITQKKNSSWVDDLDARERLNKCQRVFH